MAPRVFLSLLFILYSTLTLAESKVYTWVDATGKSHFSDTAPPGTTEIVVETQNLISSPAMKKRDPNGNTQQTINTTPQKVIKYEANIVSPQDDIAIRSNEGALEIHVETIPEKLSTQQLQLYLDGQKLGSPQISPTIRALNVDRGTHQLQVYLLDEAGQTVTTTQIVTIHLQRATIN
jgi:hypothetical protein